MLLRGRPSFESRQLAELRLPTDMGTLLGLGEGAMEDARRVHAYVNERATADGGPDRLLEAGILAPVGGVSYLPVVPRPGKIICAGMNYGAHADEAAEPGAARPDRPGAFVKLSSSLLGHDQGIAYPSETEQLDYEGELAIVIGRAALQVKPGEALTYVAGYTIMNDVSCRDIQFDEMKAGMLLLGKNAPRSSPLGPWLVTPDEGIDPHDLGLQVTVNGDVRQSGSTRDLIFGCEELISYWSATGLDAGDIIATGTPAGVGIFGEPPEQFLLHVGDVVEVTVSGLGTLGNQVITPTT
ncbi:MAG: fumarylacetoacetate hydrolase family protein [Actinomycetota bacterium]|nr:fumarylacetoacetate hydrolase family protein [Actinomycetota bacterium]